MAERVWPLVFAVGLFAGLVRAFEGMVAILRSMVSCCRLVCLAWVDGEPFTRCSCREGVDRFATSMLDFVAVVVGLMSLST